ncbi:MAG TPA: four helix bundle protein [Rhodothermales bacterium]|nr:four helix bundle protein [Rhodothermales bacterium]
MKGDNLKNRTHKFSLDAVKFVQTEPDSIMMRCARHQLARSATSVGAHYGEACRARSRREFISKIETALQELEESTFWLQIVSEAGCRNPETANALLKEANELTAIFTSSAKTAKHNLRNGK